MKTSVVFGRVVAMLTGKTTRWYKPEVRFFEVVNRETQKRYSVHVRSGDQVFVLQLPAGEYELTRVQISEGPFMSIAEFSSIFQIGTDPGTYVGTWRFGVDSPRHDRMVVISAVQDPKEQAEAERVMLAAYPILDGQLVATALPDPSVAMSRLYEVMPYPRYPRYFRRRWW